MAQQLTEAYARLRAAIAERGDEPVPLLTHLEAATAALPQPGQPGYLEGRGDQATLDHLVDTIVPALNGQNLSGRYFGFVTGGSLPVAEAADNIVSALDQSAAVHLPDQTVTTAVEDAALTMLVDVLGLGSGWTGRLFTTGATASNVLGLALARESILRQRSPTASVSELGIVAACRLAGVDDVRILTSMAHSSLYKAASIVGLGRAAVVDLPHSTAEPWRLDTDAVERELQSPKNKNVVHIISVSAGEVNAGRFATTGLADMQRLRALADAHGAWIHVDGAFGLFARALPDTAEFALLRQHAEGIELADSITADGHKLLNVPYDTGIFFSRHGELQARVFQNPNAAYLMLAASPPDAAATVTATSATATTLPSPLNMGIENSRRFRALPAYAVLLSEGRDGLAVIQARMVRLARAVHLLVRSLPAYECLPVGGDGDGPVEAAATHVCVLFRARDDALNRNLATRINATRKLYVSSTTWQGQLACRIAVSSWRANEAQDLAIVKEVLQQVAQDESD